MTSPPQPPDTDPADADQVRDEEWTAQRFPDAGPAPTNVVAVDPDAPPAPNVAHPH